MTFAFHHPSYYKKLKNSKAEKSAENNISKAEGFLNILPPKSRRDTKLGGLLLPLVEQNKEEEN